MNIDIKGVNSILLIIIIVLVLYCLLRKEMFFTSHAVPTTICKKPKNENNTFHPKSTPKPNTDNCMYIGNNKYSCKVDGAPLAPLAANSGDDNLAHAGVLGYLVGKSDANIEEMDKFDGSNMCKLCSSIPDAKTCLPSNITCEDIDKPENLEAKFTELYPDADKQAKLDELGKKYERQISNYVNENSLSNKYNYLVGACDSYCNMFNIQ